jgi:HlyD family secretion protein
MDRIRTRYWVMGLVAVLLGLALIWAFWPRATLVDMGEATRGDIAVTVDEEGRTRVRDAYIVSAPIAGRLMRVDVEPGDSVTGGESVIARLTPAPPSALDVRTREQARAAVAAAQAGLRLARADLNKALADRDLAEAELARARELAESGAGSQARLDAATRGAKAAAAALDTARAAISMRQAELARARAQLISFSQDPAPIGPAGGENGDGDGTMSLRAPISGRILRVMQESETVLAAGTAIMEIGDITNDLEIMVELLSSDAVRVSAGDRVIIDGWGGDETLSGTVARVEPWGFTKFSALGVEEQRVNAIIRFDSPLSRRSAMATASRHGS